MKHIFKEIILMLMMSVFLVGCNTETKNTKMESVFEEKIEQNLVLCFLGNKEDENIGDLYLKVLNKEKEKIGKDVLKDEFLVCNETHTVLYLDKNNTLYMKELDKEVEKISDNVVSRSYYIDEKTHTLLFLKQQEEESEKADLYVKEVGKEKEKITSDMSSYALTYQYKITPSGEIVFYINEDGDFYKKTFNKEKDKIASDVEMFRLGKTNDNYTYFKTLYNVYAKYEGEEEVQKLSNELIGEVHALEDEMGYVYIDEYDTMTGRGELCIKTKSGQTFKIASDIKRVDLSVDSRWLYYQNDEDNIYIRELPQINMSASNKEEQFLKALKETESKKIVSNQRDYMVTPLGDILLFTDENDNLYMGKWGEEKIKLATDVTTFYLFPNVYMYITSDDNLYYNNHLKSEEKITEYNVLLQENISNYHYSSYGETLVILNDERGDITLYTEGKEAGKIIEDVKDFDKVLYMNMPIYEKKLTYNDIIGNYIDDERELAFRITENYKMVIDTWGGQEIGSISPYSEGKDSIFFMIRPEFEEDIMHFSMKHQENDNYVLIQEEEEIPLKRISDDEYFAKVEKRKKEYEEYLKNEEKSQVEEINQTDYDEAVEQKISTAYRYVEDYQKYGIYVSPDNILYEYPDKNTSKLGNYSEPIELNIHDYYITEEGELWVEIQGPTGEMGWIFIPC